jgi:uncharacterized protein (TIGR02117 family)
VRRAVALLLIALISGCAAVPPAPVPFIGNAVLYVVERGWHTDIGLPVDEVTGPLASLEADFPGVKYLVFGYGERTYYMAKRAGSGEMIAALFPSKSAILLTALNAPPPVAFPDHRVAMLSVSQQGVDAIANRIWERLEKTADGSAVRLGQGPYLGSMFYASNETYDLFHTCNTWTAFLLRDGGVPINPHGVLFADQVMQQVSWLAARQAKTGGLIR